MFGYDDIYKRLRPFVERWRQLKAQQPGAKVGAGVWGKCEVLRWYKCDVQCTMPEATKGAAASGKGGGVGIGPVR